MLALGGDALSDGVAHHALDAQQVGVPLVLSAADGTRHAERGLMQHAGEAERVHARQSEGVNHRRAQADGARPLPLVLLRLHQSLADELRALHQFTALVSTEVELLQQRHERLLRVLPRVLVVLLDHLPQHQVVDEHVLAQLVDLVAEVQEALEQYDLTRLQLVHAGVGRLMREGGREDARCVGGEGVDQHLGEGQRGHGVHLLVRDGRVVQPQLFEQLRARGCAAEEEGVHGRALCVQGGVKVLVVPGRAGGEQGGGGGGVGAGAAVLAQRLLLLHEHDLLDLLAQLLVVDERRAPRRVHRLQRPGQPTLEQGRIVHRRRVRGEGRRGGKEGKGQRRGVEG